MHWRNRKALLYVLQQHWFRPGSCSQTMAWNFNCCQCSHWPNWWFCYEPCCSIVATSPFCWQRFLTSLLQGKPCFLDPCPVSVFGTINAESSLINDFNWIGVALVESGEKVRHWSGAQYCCLIDCWFDWLWQAVNKSVHIDFHNVNRPANNSLRCLHIL